MSILFFEIFQKIFRGKKSINIGTFQRSKNFFEKGASVAIDVKKTVQSCTVFLLLS